MQRCPPAAKLDELLAEILLPPESEELAAHIDTCRVCQTNLDFRNRDDSLAKGLRRLEQPEPTPPLLTEATVAYRQKPSDEEVPPGDERAGLPDALGPYPVRALLGEGGMGRVYLADDPLLRRPVAVKVMRPQLADHPEARERFLREARAAAAVRSDHVVIIHHVGEADGAPYLAMELLEGETLEARLRREGRLSNAEVVRIGRESALGLMAAHAKGLVHRDVKPANIWLEDRPGCPARVKILDFGLAKPGETDVALTGSGLIAGTPQYMAPEQARGETVDARADLFALGCVLYRITTGRPPFQGPSVTAVLTAVAVDTPPPPRSLNPELPPALSHLIVRLLEKDPANRPSSASEVVSELDRLGRESSPPTSRKRLLRGFGSIEEFVGGGNNTFTGANDANLWSIDGFDRGTVDGIRFSGFGNLTGGSSTDEFDFLSVGLVTGKVTGGSGIDRIDYSAYTFAITVNLATSTAPGLGTFATIEGVTGTAGTDYLIGADNTNTWTLNGDRNGAVDGFTFDGFEVLVGGSAADTFKEQIVGIAPQVIRGGGGADTLTGFAVVGTVWNVTGADSGTLRGISFSEIETLTGSTLGDTFVLGPSGSISGQIAGGGGTDILDVSGLIGPVVVDLTTSTVIGVAKFNSIERIVGNGTTDAKLVGKNATNTWTLTGLNTGSVGTTTFAGFGHLIGGTGNDTFVLNGVDGATKIDGGGGVDTLDYSKATADVIVRLDLGTASGVGALSGFESVLGGSGNDILIGDGLANTLKGNGGNDILIGGLGNDSLDGGAGWDILIGGSGTDQLTGGTEADILIGGRVSFYDEVTQFADLIALRSIQLEWGRPDATSIPERVAHLSGTQPGGLNGGYFLTSLNVFDDGELDTVPGTGSTDWKWWI